MKVKRNWLQPRKDRNTDFFGLFPRLLTQKIGAAISGRLVCKECFAGMRVLRANLDDFDVNVGACGFGEMVVWSMSTGKCSDLKNVAAGHERRSRKRFMRDLQKGAPSRCLVWPSRFD
jgi:hypothetical protein